MSVHVAASGAAGGAGAVFGVAAAAGALFVPFSAAAGDGVLPLLALGAESAAGVAAFLILLFFLLPLSATGVGSGAVTPPSDAENEATPPEAAAVTYVVYDATVSVHVVSGGDGGVDTVPREAVGDFFLLLPAGPAAAGEGFGVLALMSSGGDAGFFFLGAVGAGAFFLFLCFSSTGLAGGVTPPPSDADSEATRSEAASVA